MQAILFIKKSLFILALFFCSQVTHAFAHIPPIGRVVDLTYTLNTQQVQQLTKKVQHFEGQTGAQIAILIVDTTQPESIEEYSLRVEETWKLGKKNIDDGILFVVAMKDRTMRIEVGYGLEGPLNDATSKRIISDIVTPCFKKGQYFEGISNGIDQITKTIKGDSLPSNSFSTNPSKVEPLPTASNLKNSQQDLPFGFILFLIIIISVIISGIFWSIFGDEHNRKMYSAAAISIIATIIVLIITVSLFNALCSGLMSFVAAIIGYRKNEGGGSSSSGGGGGGSSNGGGFSGGGGSSGGGGASGRW